MYFGRGCKCFWHNFRRRLKNWGIGLRHAFRKTRGKSSENINLGSMGESIAVDFLKKKKFKILSRNWTFGRGEIDIVALDESEKQAILVFVEVRLRAADAFKSGYFSVDAKKKDILRRTCKAYLRKFLRSHICYRFDIIEIKMDRAQQSQKISHFENVKLF
jgi:putative endonuclease